MTLVHFSTYAAKFNFYTHVFSLAANNSQNQDRKSLCNDLNSFNPTNCDLFTCIYTYFILSNT